MNWTMFVAVMLSAVVSGAVVWVIMSWQITDLKDEAQEQIDLLDEERSTLERIANRYMKERVARIGRDTIAYEYKGVDKRFVM